jgi:hypothetical protein
LRGAAPNEARERERERKPSLSPADAALVMESKPPNFDVVKGRKKNEERKTHEA